MKRTCFQKSLGKRMMKGYICCERKQSIRYMFDLQHRQDNGILKARPYLKFAQFEIKGI
jgi:hypothetical protein